MRVPMPATAFVLVYNLYDTADLYHRFAAGEGQAYLIGGFTVSYLRRGNVVLIPVRAGRRAAAGREHGLHEILAQAELAAVLIRPPGLEFRRCDAGPGARKFRKFGSCTRRVGGVSPAPPCLQIFSNSPPMRFSR